MNEDYCRITDQEGHVQIAAKRHLKWWKPEEIKHIEHDIVLTADEIAELLDSDAENENYHGLVGRHAWLVKIVRDAAGDEAALKVITAIGDSGGLHASM